MDTTFTAILKQDLIDEYGETRVKGSEVRGKLALDLVRSGLATALKPKAEKRNAIEKATLR